MDDKEPGVKHLAGLIDNERNDQVRAIFVQPQFSSKTASAIAQAFGAQVVRLDPLAADYISYMKQIARTITEFL